MQSNEQRPRIRTRHRRGPQRGRRARKACKICRRCRPGRQRVGGDDVLPRRRRGARGRAGDGRRLHPSRSHSGVSKHSSVARRWRLGVESVNVATPPPRERTRARDRRQKNKHRATASSPRTRPSRGAAPRRVLLSWAPRPRRSTPWATRSSRSASRRRPA